jgi:hypothetical protein
VECAGTLVPYRRPHGRICGLFTPSEPTTSVFLRMVSLRSDWSVLSALDEWARRGGPARIDTPLACYLIVSFRWLSSGACLTIVIL